MISSDTASPKCTQKLKSFWISTFSSFGSSFLLLSIISLMIYFSFWRNKTKTKLFINNMSHLSFVISLFVKSIGFCAAGILLRLNNIDWEYISPFILDVPQSTITFGFSLIFMLCCLSYGRLLSKQQGEKLTKVVYGVSTLSFIFMVCGIILSILHFTIKKSLFNSTNVWISFIRDIVIALSFIILFSLIKKQGVVQSSNSSNSEKNITILTFITLACMLLRGISFPIQNYAFSPTFSADLNSNCGMGSILYFIFQTIIGEILPTICVFLIQGMMDAVFSYDSIE